MQQYKIYAHGSPGEQIFPSAYAIPPREIVVYRNSLGHIFCTVALITSPYLYNIIKAKETGNKYFVNKQLGHTECLSKHHAIDTS